MSEPTLIVVNQHQDGSPDFSYESWQLSHELMIEELARQKLKERLLAVAAKWRAERQCR